MVKMITLSAIELSIETSEGAANVGNLKSCISILIIPGVPKTVKAFEQLLQRILGFKNFYFQFMA